MLIENKAHQHYTWYVSRKTKKDVVFPKTPKTQDYGYTNITLFPLIINNVSNSIITICTRQCIVLRLYINWTNIYFISYYIRVNFWWGKFRHHLNAWNSTCQSIYSRAHAIFVKYCYVFYKIFFVRHKWMIKKFCKYFLSAL